MAKQGFLSSALAGATGLWQKRSRTADPDLSSSDPERQGQALFRRGRQRMRSGDLEAALEDFDRAIELVPDFADAVASRAARPCSRGPNDDAPVPPNGAWKSTPVVG